MNRLYEHMKDALDFFGLKFADMDKVGWTIINDNLVFNYEGRSIVIDPNK